MRITFLGGADEVGASCILIEMSGRRLLVDAGIRPSPKARDGLAGDQLPDLSRIEPGGLDTILVTHAHTDHTGALELVSERYPRVPVYAAPITIALTRVLHQDARRIMQTRLEQEGELPLFDDVSVGVLMEAFVPVPFHTRLPLAEGLVATFYPSGHIAGAAMLGLEGDEGRILISGDVSISPQRTVDGAKPPPFRPNVLILESTYGGKLHANRAVEERRLVETVSAVIANGGKVLIPAFALGRAQEVILTLNAFRRRAELPNVPVWIDGMVRAVCQAYTQFIDALPLALQERAPQPFFDAYTHVVQHAAQRNDLIWQAEPAVIVASSGMLAGGPSQTFARALAPQPQHAILLTGYQDEESPGRRLQEMAQRGKGTLRIGKDRLDVQCQLGTYSLSAHADEAQLVSLSEALDPDDILLVHGNDDARNSLAAALRARGRQVRQPRAGQSFEFRYAPSPASRGAPRAPGRPLDVPALWRESAAPGAYYTLNELARAWWGGDERAAELEKALAADALYFAPDERRADIYRARTQAQVAQGVQRRSAMAQHARLAGQWLVMRDAAGELQVANVAALGSDRFWVEGDVSPHYPEDIVELLGASIAPPAAETILARYHMPSPPGTVKRTLEPNEALALVRASFPLDARLVRAGYRLAEKYITLSFDFPDLARARFAELLQRLETQTGWQIAIDPETNQAALAMLARELLGPDLRIVKGPSIHRLEKRVAVMVEPPGPLSAEALAAAEEQFRAASGFGLGVTIAGEPSPAAPGPPPAASAAAWEINAAYAEIRRALAGSTLYRTSLKDGAIVLSFISPQAGERERAVLDVLAERIGWPLSIHPQPNQNALLELARTVVARAGWQAAKAPSVHVERGEVVLALAGQVEAEARAAAAAEFERQAGYRLVLDAPPNAATGAAGANVPHTAEPVDIPLARIRLNAAQQSMPLNPDKLRKAIERAQRQGAITPPVQVRREADGYRLLDGVYRMRAAAALGWTRISAVVEL